MIERPRRLRKSETIRNLVRETSLSKNDLIYPIFIEEGKNIKKEISTMPGIFRYSLDKIDKELEAVSKLGIQSLLLFGIPKEKDEEGSNTWNENGIIQQALRHIKKHFPNLYLITDICFCEYTSHGHCGVLHNHDVDNDKTLINTQKQVVSHAQAGADMVAPSGMMDGIVGAIRSGLDEKGFENVPIMAYSAKYASAFYGPFRNAADSTPSFGNRNTYQMDIANSREAFKELKLDAKQGADILMVKPALSYLDIISKARANFDLPIAAYSVSGEYAMIKAAAKLGYADEQKLMYESTLSIKRAGADIIITYFAKELAQMIY